MIRKINIKYIVLNLEIRKLINCVCYFWMKMFIIDYKEILYYKRDRKIRMRFRWFWFIKIFKFESEIFR